MAQVLIAIVAFPPMVAYTQGIGEGTEIPDPGITPVSGGAVLEGNENGWTVQAADFNYDNMADLLWYHPGQNVIAVWLMNGTRPLMQGPDIPGPAGGGWSLAAMVDFNYDGMADLLWHNAKKRVIVVWLMNGTRVLIQGPEIAGKLP